MRAYSLMCVVLVAGLGGVARGDDWAGWGLDGARHRHAAERTGAAFTHEWRYVLLGETELSTKAIVSSPAAADGVVVFGTQRNFLDAIDASTGAKRWRFEPESGVLASPTIHRGRVYVPSLDGTLYAIKESDGTLAWKAELGVGYGAPAFVNDERGDALIVAAYVPVRRLFRLDAATGKVVWQTADGAVANGSASSVAVKRDVAVVGIMGGWLQAFDVRTGESRWRHDTGGGDIFITSPSIVDESVYSLSGGARPRVHAVGLASGVPRAGWPIDLQPPAHDEKLGVLLTRELAKSSLSVTGNRLVAQLRFTDVIDANKDTAPDRYVVRERVIALDLDEGRVLWQLDVGTRNTTNRSEVPLLTVVGTPAAFEGTDGQPLLAVASSLEAAIRVVDARTGAQRWSGELRAPTRSSPTFANGRLYVATDAGTVESFLSQVNRPPAPPALPSSEAVVTRAGGVIRWMPAADAEREPLTYLVRVDRDGEVLEDWEMEVVTAPGATHAPLPRALEEGASYGFAIRSRDPQGAWSAWSPVYPLKTIETPSVTLGGVSRTLPEALRDARPGDTLAIGPGVYRLGETMNVPPGVTLTGSGPQATVLLAEGLEVGVSLKGRVDGRRGTVKSLTVTGASIGIEIADRADVELRNVVVRKNEKAGVSVAEGATALVANATLARNGIAVDARATATVTVKNALVLDNAVGFAAAAEGATFTSRYNDLFDNAVAYQGLSAHATDLSRAVAFTDRDRDDFRVARDQPSTDKGDPTDDFAQEPLPNGSRVNLGAFGNTPEAEQSAPPTAPTPPTTVKAKSGGGCATGGRSSDAGGALVVVLAVVGVTGVVRRRGRGRARMRTD